MVESTRERRRRLRRIKRPRLNSKGKRRARAMASMKAEVEGYKSWLDTVIGRLEGMLEKEKEDGHGKG